jgi:hypothetical protein
MLQFSQRQAPASVFVRSSAEFTCSPAQGPYDHQPMGMSSEGPLEDKYLLVVSTQKTRTRRLIGTTGLNETRDGRMLGLSSPRENVNTQAVSTDSMG